MTISVADADWALFFGCLLTAFGPLVSLFFVVVSCRAQLVILAIAAAFAWLVSILVSSLFWIIIPPLKESISATVPLSVLIQELFRYGLFRAYVSGENAIKQVTTSDAQLPLNDFTSSLAAGVGFSLMQVTMMYGSVLASSLGGKGAVFTDACSDLPLIFVSGLHALAFGFMNVALMIMAFNAYRQGSVVNIALIVILHMAAALATLFNLNDDGCVYSIPLSFGVALLSCAGAFVTIKKRRIIT